MTSTVKFNEGTKILIKVCVVQSLYFEKEQGKELLKA